VAAKVALLSVLQTIFAISFISLQDLCELIDQQENLTFSSSLVKAGMV